MAFHPPRTFTPPHTFSNTTSAGPGRHAHLFQPPQSPASSFNTPSLSTGTDYFSSGSRKRARPDSSHGVDQRVGQGQTPSWAQCPTPSDASYTSAGPVAPGQHSMYVNERYALAGGFDTPTLEATTQMEQRQQRMGTEGRRRRGDVGSEELDFSPTTPLSGPLARERNGVARLPSSPNGGTAITWTGFAFGLVGKMFTFGTSVVKGFYAGGGKGYDLKRSPLQSSWRTIIDNREPCSTPLPGAWQDDEFLGDFEQDNPHSPPTTASRPPNKRRQTDKDSWVMVGTPDMETSPRRKASSTSVPRSNLAVRPSASRASSRRSLAPLPRRSSHATYSTGSPGQPAPIPLSPDRRASFAPLRSPSRPSSSSGLPNTAYISPEAEKYIKRREKQDRKADAAIGDMSRKLADLIRQGQEALGTKISVVGGEEETDEGFVDEEW